MAKPKRPLTQRELRELKKKKSTSELVILINKSSNQTVPIQLKAPPGTDWFVGEMTVPLYPKRMGKFPKNRLYTEQINNYQKQGRIQVIKSAP
jgi:hypothetical protein